MARTAGSRGTRRAAPPTGIRPRAVGPLVAPVLLTPLLLALGCGGAGLRGDTYRDGEASYRVGRLDDGWEPLRVADQNDLAWRHPRLGAIIQVNATCDPFADVPLTSLTGHLLIGFTDRELRAQERVPMDGREALRTHVVASIDGVPRELLLFVLKKDYCTYDFALVAPPGERFASARGPFESFVAGFTTRTAEP